MVIQMRDYEFRVLCSDKHACGQVMAGMKQLNFKNVVRTPESPISDHKALLKSDNVDEARRKGRDLLHKYKGKIQEITVTPK